MQVDREQMRIRYNAGLCVVCGFEPFHDHPEDVWDRAVELSGIPHEKISLKPGYRTRIPVKDCE